MEYQRLIQAIARKTGIDELAVREVLNTFPDVLLECQVDEKTRTPLGVFTLVERKSSKPVVTPSGHQGSAKPQLIVRLKPGKRLRFELNEPSHSSDPTHEKAQLELGLEDPEL